MEVLAGWCTTICKEFVANVYSDCMYACREGEWVRRSVLRELEAHSLAEFSRGFDVCLISLASEQIGGGKHSSKICVRMTMQEEGKHCHSLGTFPPSTFPYFFPYFLLKKKKKRQESERESMMWLIFLPFPFLPCKFLNRPKRINCFFRFYQQEGNRTELQFSAQRLLSCLAGGFEANK